MRTKKNNDSSLAASPEWLVKLARDYYARSCHAEKPGDRENSRQRFVATIKQLLTLVPPGDIIGAFGGPFHSPAPDEVVAIINRLAAQTHQQPAPQPAKALKCPTAPQAAHSDVPAGERAEITRLLAAGLEPLPAALKLLQRPGPGEHAAAPASVGSEVAA